MKKNSIILKFCICIFTCFFCLTSCSNNTVENKKQNYDTNLEETKEDFSDVETEFYLENGYYTIGIDIPAGVCSIYATAGTGNILYSADGTIDTYSEYDDDLNQLLSNTIEGTEKIVDYTLKEGYVIHISGAVRVKMTFSQINSRYVGRIYDEKNKFILESGSYVAGEDFESGIYTITAINGNGTLYSSNSFTLGIDELFGVFNGQEVYVPKTVNVTLNKGDIINIDDVTVEFLKAK